MTGVLGNRRWRLTTRDEAAGCARRRPVEKLEDAGSIPATSTTACSRNKRNVFAEHALLEVAGGPEGFPASPLCRSSNSGCCARPLRGGDEVFDPVRARQRPRARSELVRQPIRRRRGEVDPRSAVLDSGAVRDGRACVEKPRDRTDQGGGGHVASA